MKTLTRYHLTGRNRSKQRIGMFPVGSLPSVPSVISCSARSRLFRRPRAAALCLLLWLAFTLPLFATTVYDNSINDLFLRFNTGAAEAGDEIVLAGTDRYLTNFSFEYWGTNSASPGNTAFSGSVQVRIRFYLNDGPPSNGFNTPGTIFYDSGWLGGFGPTPASTLVFTAGTDFPANGLFIPASNVTWSVQFQGLGATDSLGVDLYSPPVIGSNFPHYWETTGVGWTFKTNAAPADFGARLMATTPTATPPSITSQPQSVTVAATYDASFSVTASGTPPFAYQWRKDGTNVSGATDATLMLTSVSASAGGIYSVVVSNAAGSVTSSNAVLTVAASVLIHRYPLDSDASDAVGSANGTLTGGAAIASNSLQLDGVGAYVQFGAQIVPTSRSYSVALFARQTASQSGYIELISQGFSGGPGFYIGLDPGGEDLRVTDSWPGTGVAIPSVGNWHHYALVVDSGLNLSRLYVDGTLAATLGSAISTTSAGSATRLGRQFDPFLEYFQGAIDEVRIYQGTLTSQEVGALAAATPPSPPMITVQPQSQTVAAGASAVFSVTAGGAPPLTYQWTFNGTSLTNTGRFSGSQSNTLTIANVQPGDAGTYQVIVSNAAGATNSAAATLSVLQVLAHDDAAAYDAAGGIWSSGMNFGFGFLPWVIATAGAGQQGAFVGDGGNIATTNNSAWGLFASGLPLTNMAVAFRGFSNALPIGVPFKLEWRTGDIGFNPYNFAGFSLRTGNANSSTLDYTTGERFSLFYRGGGTNGSGRDDVQIRDGSGEGYAPAPGVTFLNLHQGAAIEFTLLSSNTYRLVVRDAATASVLAAFDDRVLAGAGPIQSVALYDSQTDGGGGEYDGNQLFNNLEISSLPAPPAVAVTPASLTAAPGSTVTFKANAAGTLPLGYQWQFNGANLADGAKISGSRSNTLSVANVTPNDAGDYQVIVTNIYGSVTSAAAALTVSVPTNIAYLRTLVDPVNYAPTDTVTLFTVQGIVTTWTNLTVAASTEFFIQDATAGIAVFWSGAAGSSNTPPAGALVQVTAPLNHFNGLLELAPVFTNSQHNVTILSTGNPLPAPVSVPFDPATQANIPLMEMLEGRYAVASNVFLNLGSSNFVSLSGGEPITNTLGQTFLLFANSHTDIPGQPKVAGPVTIYGVLGQFDTNAPFTTGYELTPSRYADIVPQAPLITAQPAGRSVVAGTNVTFSVTALGAVPLSYQWRKNGTNIVGATSASYSISSVQTSDVGTYSVMVSDVGGSVTSAGAFLSVIQYEPYTFITLAGVAGGAGEVDGIRTAARFNDPAGVAVDSAGNVYVVDFNGHTVRKVTPRGLVTTLAGLGGVPGTNDGVGSAARFTNPNGVAVDRAGNVYVPDRGNSTVRKLTLTGTNYVVTTLAGLPRAPGANDGVGSAARFNGSGGAALDSATNLYVTDALSQTIRRITPAGVVTTIAGLAGSIGTADGTNSNARFNEPDRVAVDSADNIYVADTGNNRIRKITPAGNNWVVTTLVGGAPGTTDGTAAVAQLGFPEGVVVDSSGNVFIADDGNRSIRKLTPAGVVTTLAGSPGISGSADGTGSAARFSNPFGVAVDSVGNLYVPDGFNFTIRKGWPATGGSAPVVTVQPQSQTVSPGQSVGFNVTAIGAGVLSYQWAINGLAIAGATNESYTVPNAQTGNAGNYQVVVSSAFGSITSAVATLTVVTTRALTLLQIGFEVPEGYVAGQALGGQQGWGAFTSPGNVVGGNGVAAGLLPTSPQQAFLGGVPGSTNTDVNGFAGFSGVNRYIFYQPPAGGPGELDVSWTQEITASTNGAYNYFEWDFYNSQGRLLGGLLFLNGPQVVRRRLEDNSTPDTGVGFARGQTYPVSVRWDFANNLWTATVGTNTLPPLPITTNGLALTLGVMNVSWWGHVSQAPFPGGPVAGDNQMIFDDLTFTASAPNRLVWISPGTCLMGSPTSEAGRDPKEGPQTQVTLTRGFWMSQYEVAQSDYISLLGSNPSYFQGDTNRPVEQVSWSSAVNYCNQLTARENAGGRLPSGYIYRLPTEAEWEYAARAGTTTRWSFGDDASQLPSYGWFILNSGCQYTNDPTCATTGSTQPVGQKLPNPWGLYDIHGNVGEWVSDWYAPYPGGSVTDPVGPLTGTQRIFRAPAWDFGDIYSRSAGRWGVTSPGLADNSVGFRVVLGPSYAPFITGQPASQTVVQGSSLSFTVAAVGTAPLSYQWLFNGAPLSDNARISGSQTSSLSFNGALTTDTGTYQLIITNAYGSVTSSVVTLAVLPPANPPSQLIYLNGFDDGIGTEWSSTLTDTTQLGNRRFLGQFSDSQTVSLTLSNLPPHTVLSVELDLFVLRTWDGNYPFSGTGPDIWTMTVGGGGPTLFRTTFDNHVNGEQAYPGTYPAHIFTDQSGAVETATLGYLGDFANQDAVYHLSTTFAHTNPSVILSFSSTGLEAAANESWGLDNVRVGLVSNTIPPAILVQPQGRTVAATYTANLGVTLSGTQPFSYQWRKNGTNVAAATSSVLTFTTVSTNNAGDYTVVVTNSAGSITSSVATLAVPVAYAFITFAGSPTLIGTNDATGTLARFNSQRGLVADNAGNLYVADQGNNTIRKITPNGVVTTLAGLGGAAGSADGLGAAARFNSPFGVAVDAAGTVYVTDRNNQTIRAISPAGLVTTIAGTAGIVGINDGPGNAALFNFPTGIAADTAGNLYVADNLNNTVRRLTPAGTNWVVTTFAGTPGVTGVADGTGSAASFNKPNDLSVDSSGNVYVTDNSNNTIRKITPSGVVTTIAGVAPVFASYVDAVGSLARFRGPYDAVVDGLGNVFVTDRDDHVIRQIAPDRTVTTIAGHAPTAGSANGSGNAVFFNLPRGAAVDPAGNLYIADSLNNTIRKGVPDHGQPIISTQPQNSTVPAGTNVSFSVFATGPGTLRYQWRLNGANVSGATNTTLILANVQPSNAGDYRVIITNANGGVTSVVAKLTVQLPLFITCAPNRTVECGASWDFDVPAASASCTNGTNVTITIFNTQTNPIVDGAFTATRTWLATDSCGNSVSCSQTISNLDTTPPAITVLGPNPLTNECHTPFLDPGATANDICAGNLGVVTNSTVNPNAVGTYSISYTATDPNGNSSTNTRIVRIVDTTPPQITCPPKLNVAETPRNSGGAIVTFSTPAANDTCDSAPTVTCSPPSASLFPVGSNTVVCTAVDASGNSNSCSFIVRVIPYRLPVVVSTLADSGPGTLRQAILDANDSPDENLVVFSLPGSAPYSIHLLSALPAITSPIILDGSSQPGFVGTPLIELDGSTSSNAIDGLVIRAGSSTVRALDLHGFANAIRLENNGGNIIQGNFIGTDTTGTNASGNSVNGIYLTGGTAANLIGGAATGLGNLIAFNARNGIALAPSAGLGNQILGNSIVSNGSLGIDLRDDGPTPNDADDSDTGPNGLQNFPVLTDALSSDDTITISGYLISLPNTAYQLDFYLNDSVDPSGYGEGQIYLGAASVTTDGSGSNAFSVTFPTNALFTQFITATATDPANNTSEFSAAKQVRTPPVIAVPAVPMTNAPSGSNAVFSLQIANRTQEPLIWQWRLNGVNIPGATSSSYTTPPVGLDNSGGYEVIVANSVGIVGEVQVPLVLAGVSNLLAHDNFADRFVLVGPAGTNAGDNFNATAERGEPLHAGKVGGKSVWYAWPPPYTGVATFTTRGSTFDTLLGVYTGNSVSNLVKVAGDDNRGGLYTSKVRFNVFLGTYVNIAIDGFAGQDGQFLLSWQSQNTDHLLPVFLLQPTNRTAEIGSSVTFSALAAKVCKDGKIGCPDTNNFPPGEQPGLDYQWYFNGSPIPGATGTSVTINNVQSANVGNYSLMAMTGFQTNESDAATLQINISASNSQFVQGFDRFEDAQTAVGVSTGNGPLDSVPVDPPDSGHSGGPLDAAPTPVAGIINMDTTLAGTDPTILETFCGTIAGASEWYPFTSNLFSGVLYLDTGGSTFNTLLAMCYGSQATILACDTNSVTNLTLHVATSQLQVPIVAKDRHYFIGVDGVGGASGVCALHYTLFPPPKLQFVGRTPQGANRLQVIGQTGQTNMHFTLQASTDLRNWTNIFTMTASSPTNVLSLVDTNSVTLPRRFYRALLIPWPNH